MHMSNKKREKLKEQNNKKEKIVLVLAQIIIFWHLASTNFFLFYAHAMVLILDLFAPSVSFTP